MVIRLFGLGCIALTSVFLVACGSSAPSGFSGAGDGGAGGDATLDGSGSHKDSGGIHLLPDSGKDAAHGCTGLACDVKSCDGNPSATTVSGYVYAPNGELPLYDVQVFIPNAPLDPFPPGVQCQQCGAPVSGAPITTALSDSTGHFILTGVPSGTNIPIVVQLGKWRRQTSIPTVSSCTDNPLTTPDLTRLPANQSEGSMPRIALTTGGCDQMGCMLPKVGIAASEFGSQSDGASKAVNIYTGDPTNNGFTLDPSWTPAQNLWGDPTTGTAGNIMDYDMAILSCECSEGVPSKGTAGAAPFKYMTDYLNAGGRIFTTDFQYTWYKFSPDPALGGGSDSIDVVGIGEIYGTAPYSGPPPALTLLTGFPKGVALAAWLKYVFSGMPLPSGMTYPVDTFAQMGQVSPDVVWGNTQYLNVPQTLTWATSPYTSEGSFGPPPPPPSADGIEPRVFTVETPVGDPVAKQCGRGVHIDAHVDQSDGQEVAEGYPTTGCGVPLKADEAMFAFFFFDLASCIQDQTKTPTPPPPAPQ
jgi:hypothetical protein